MTTSISFIPEIQTVSPDQCTEKLTALQNLLRGFESVVVAYSGGTDSTFVLKVAHDILGERAIAITALSPSFPSEDRESTINIARDMGVRHILIESREVDDPRYLENSPRRCYFCKSEVYDQLGVYAAQYGMKFIVDGMNEDDRSDRRPGRQAAQERGVRSPLAEVHLTKAEIRTLSRQMGLPTWDKPAMACLSSRVPFGMTITREALAQIDGAESFLRRLGIRQVRVRHHQAIARLEVEAQDIAKVVEHREEIVAQFKKLGYTFVTLDLEGYRMGSLHALENKR
jgi:uncharacterized protein